MGVCVTMGACADDVDVVVTTVVVDGVAVVTEAAGLTLVGAGAV